ncbi:hypothetical protein, partial [Streptomyces sp. SID5770]|uniref:hypothetical protein n=1 Tax=Streptomyces sp. SID5770 TaxID=2690308 RepID=UPI001F163934
TRASDTQAAVDCRRDQRGHTPMPATGPPPCHSIVVELKKLIEKTSVATEAASLRKPQQSDIE